MISSICNASRRNRRIKSALHENVAANGQFDVSTRGDGVLVPHDARTYTNAVTWLDGNDRYILDRTSSELKVKPADLTYKFEKIGGRKFG